MIQTNYLGTLSEHIKYNWSSFRNFIVTQKCSNQLVHESMRLSSKNSERNCERPSLVWFQCRRRRGVRAWRRRQRHPISVSWHCLTPERLLTNFCLTTHPKAFLLRRDALANFYHLGSHTFSEHWSSFWSLCAFWVWFHKQAENFRLFICWV